MKGDNSVAEQAPTDESWGDHSLGKRKRDDVDKADGDSKLQEFLEVMQPPSKSRTWANEGSAGTRNAPDLATQDQVQKAEASQSDEEYEAVPKKCKSPNKLKDLDESERPAENVATTAGATEDSENCFESAKGGNGLEPARGNVSEPSGNTVPAASDEDWLRLRTSRLLGLVDDDDSLEPKPLPRADGEFPEDSTVVRQPQGRGMSHASVRANEETSIPDVRAVERSVPGNENIDHSTGRLFVRNLMYTTTEHDLRRHFEANQYGSIEEVCLGVLFLISTTPLL